MTTTSAFKVSNSSPGGPAGTSTAPRGTSASNNGRQTRSNGRVKG